MAEKISIQIGLEGGDKVEQQLTDIGKAGQQSFDQISTASETAATGIAKTGEATDKASESTSKLSLETVRLTTAIADNISGIVEHGVAIGLAVKRHESLIESLLKLVSGANTAVRALSLVAPELTVIGAGALALAGPIAGAVVAFEAIEKAATKAAAGYEKLNHSLQMLAETSGQSFKSLQDGKAAFEQLGIGGDRFEGVVTKINEAMSSLDIGAKFAEGADNIAKAATFSSEHFKALANNMGAVLPLVKQIEEGAKGLTFNELTTAQTKIDAVTASMKQAVDAGKNAGQVLLQFIVAADKMSAIQVGKGFGITEEDVDRIRRLAANGVTVEEIFKRIQGAGVLISPESAAAFDNMRDSIARADSAWARLKQSLASTIFATLGAQVSSVFNDIEAKVLNTAAAIVEAFNSAATQAIAALKRIGQSDWGQSINQTAQNAVTGLNSIVANVVGGILKGMGVSADAIKTVQNQINGLGQAAAEAGQKGAQGLQLMTNPLTGMPELVNTTNQALAQTGKAGAEAGQQAAQGFQVWNEELGKAVPATQQVTSATQQANTAVSDFISKISTIAWDTISSLGVAAWNALTGAIQGAIDKLLQFIGLKPSAPATGGGAPAAARGGLLGGRGSGTSDSNLAWVSRGEHIMPASVVRRPGVLSLLEALRRGGGIPGFAAGGSVDGSAPVDPVKAAVFAIMVRVIEQLSQAMNQAIQQLQQIGESNKQFAEDVAGQLNLIGQGLIENADQVIESLRQVGVSLGDAVIRTAQTKARGGLLGGRGSGTSDSNLAWVSRGEYITPARAVAQPGVLAFLEALRRSGGNLSRVLDGMGRFALGGMVPTAMPAFASGGLAGAMSNVTIQFPGLPAIGGLRASADVVDQLHRAAALAQVRSGGRKPSRYS